VKDRTLLDIFLTQAASALGAREDPNCTKHERAREIADLRGAVELLGNAEIESRVEEIIVAWQAGQMQCGDDLAAMVRELRPPRAPVLRGTAASEGKSSGTGESAALAAGKESGDSAATKVQASPRRRSNKFDTGEHLTLLNFFREEASEGLDDITDLLLMSTASRPTDIVFDELMRLTHGLKGAAGTVDLPTIAELSHQFEDAIERIRQGLLPWTALLRDELVDVADQLRIVRERTDRSQGSWLRRRAPHRPFLNEDARTGEAPTARCCASIPFELTDS
jgi:HPt (histidine-containing phosphotransfer) domain-containing protein